MTTDAKFTIIHVSDLHLRHPLTAAGRKLKSRLGTRTHAFHLIEAASVAIKQLHFQYPNAYLVASGDLTTLGDPTSFDLSRQFLEKPEVIWEEARHSLGLDFQESYCVVPGNHDRYDEYPWKFQYEHFETEFSDILPTENFRDYGINIRDNWERINRKLPFVKVLSCDLPNDKLILVIIGLNSTAKMGGGNILQQTAQGFVPTDELVYIEQVMSDIERGRVTSSTGARINIHSQAVFAMAVLHHHAYVPPDVDTSFFMKLTNADVVVQRCRLAGVNMLAFGHQHVAFVDPVTFGTRTPDPSQIFFAASGSLSVHGESSNSFNVYHIGEETISYEIWIYQEGRFLPGPVGGTYRWHR